MEKSNSIIIAVTSQNYRTVTKHAGLCRKLLVYKVQLEEDGKTISDIKEIDRISVSKEESLHTCKQDEEHPIDIADMLICGSCGEGFIKKMAGRGIAVSVATKDDPVEAIKEFLANDESHYTCDGPHQEEVKRHPNCPHNKKHDHTHGKEGSCGCGGHDHAHGHGCDCGGSGCSCHED